TTLWALTQPGAIRWGEQGIALETIELRSDEGGRIYADGELPSEGAGDLVLDIEQLQIANVMGLRQDTVAATGVFSLYTEVAGTQASPRFEGSMQLRRASYGGTELPDVRALFEYADTRLEAEAVFLRDSVQLAVAEAELPLNLALAGDAQPRLPEGPLLVELRADSLPLDALPHLTDAVADVRGRLRGHVVVRGSYEDPDASGTIDLDLARLTVVPAGIALREVAGVLRLRDERVVIDSLVAHSGEGLIRLTGAVEIDPLTEPSLALELKADDALVLDNEWGRVWADAALEIEGPFEAVHITGDIEIDRGVVYMPQTTQVMDLSDPAYARALDSLNVAPEVLPEPNPLLDNLRVDVNVAIDRSTWMRGDQVNVGIYTPAEAGPLVVHMDRGEEVLTVRGTVATGRGEYFFSGKYFEVVGGSVVFLGASELDPLLQITAQHTVNVPGRSPLGIRVIIGGTLSEPTFALDSDAQPPLSESDLLSYLAFGRSSSTLLQQRAGGLSGGRGSGSLVGNLGALATEQLATTALGAIVSDLERDTKRAVGLDVLRITPAELPPDLALDGYVNVLRGTEIEIGKYLTDRWFIASKARPTLVTPGARVEYQTARGFRWVITYEPRFLPRQPTFGTGVDPSATPILGSFLFFERRF
ncbi:MAG TPA: translocation/assembly module TamB domain-containing protein, partial [Longimicrobiaceae bacterium]|nr:translocation/assembly module TamB domain-containing protein [Longimicrobiaceae bacterium]